MRRFFTTSVICLLLVLATGSQDRVSAQGNQVTGTVTAADTKLPAAGVTVSVKGTRTSTTTNAQGQYRIQVGATATTLVFSSASFLPLEVAITGNTIDAELQPDFRSLNDVVVIGYQTVKRKDLLASVSSVNAKDLKDIPINSAAEALNGRLAGVTATTSEGSPDATVRIRVRGGMSITGDNSPLYIIDGVQVENGINTISPQDIQSIDVLKDAAALSIYGTRAANGVIIITTKSGRPGKTIISYNGFIGVKLLAKKLNVLDPYDYVLYQSERSRGSSTDSTSFTNNFGHTFDSLDRYRYVDPVDWQEEIFGRTGVTQTHNIGLSGGNAKATYIFGYTFNKEEAVVINSSYKRHLLNLKGDYKITKDIKIGAGVRYSNQDVFGAGVSDAKGSSYNRLRNAVKFRPFLSAGQDIDDTDPLADINVGNGLNLVNPISLANAEYRKKSTESFNATVYLSYNITKNLNFKSTASFDYNIVTDLQYSDTITPYSIISGAKKPIAGLDTTQKKTYTNSNVLLYSVKGWKGGHDFDFMVGEETYELKTESRSNLFKNFPSFTSYNTAFKNTTLGIPFTGYPKLGKTRYTNLSFFGRINYAFKDKYFFQANIRRDGASKFRPGKQWGNFPSASVAWRISKEKFLETSRFINDLKFRVGFGTIGNNRINDYLFLTTFSNNGTYYYGINNQAIISYYPNSLPNPDLQWESTVSRNFGVDISLLNRKINLSVDIYDNSSSHLLLDVPIASTYGYVSQFQNVGKTSNKGVEFQLNTDILKSTSGLNWSANFNISFNKNKIVQLGTGQQSFFTGGVGGSNPSWGVSGQPSDYIFRVGDPVGQIWGLVTDGFYTVDDFDYIGGVYTLKTGRVTDVGIIGAVQPGSIRFKDLNGDKVIDLTNDRKAIGNPNPKFTGGLNQQFTYKNWDMSLFVNFTYGNDVYNANKIEFTNGYSNNSNMLDIMSRRWKVVTQTGQTAQWVNGSGQVVGIPPDQLAALNQNATIWQPLKSAGAFYPHSWAIEDGSFLRFNNFTIGYSFPASKLAGTMLSKLRLYATANNLAIITNYTGYDPEVSVKSSPLTPGLDYSAYPKSRSFLVGVNITFR
jgi:TonB-linked SusC/RagA family outer membrane protein